MPLNNREFDRNRLRIHSLRKLSSFKVDSRSIPHPDTVSSAVEDSMRAEEQEETR